MDKQRTAVTYDGEQFQVVYVNETFEVQGVHIEQENNEYWIPADGSVADHSTWIIPMDNLDGNLNRLYAEFRRLCHYLTPEQIRSQRQELHLTLRETAAILGMSYSTLSDIENALVLQNQLQETSLECLQDQAMREHLVRNRYYQLQSSLGQDGAERVLKKLGMPVPDGDTPEEA
jgi:DNA-binding transcriptional regulator YiaG